MALEIMVLKKKIEWVKEKNKTKTKLGAEIYKWKESRRKQN